MHPAYDGLAALPYYDEFDLSTVDVLLISQYVLFLSPSNGGSSGTGLALYRRKHGKALMEDRVWEHIHPFAYTTAIQLSAVETSALLILRELSFQILKACYHFFVQQKSMKHPSLLPYFTVLHTMYREVEPPVAIVWF